MKFVCRFALASLVCLAGGCSTAPRQANQSGPSTVSNASASPQTISLGLAENPALLPNQPEDGDNERPRGEEVRRHAEAAQQHDRDPNYHPPRDFTGFYASCPTTQLKAIALRHGELLWKKYAVRDLSMRASTHHELADPVGQELFEELMEAKRELWRRWKAGDVYAKLP
jgi:hypothetical protein